MRPPDLQRWYRADLLGTAIPRLAAPLLPAVAWRGPPRTADDKAALYLTFDDGPDPAATPALLDRLDRLGARAVFFVLGERAERHPHLVRAMQEAGHAVGVHGWDHADAWRTSRPVTLAAFDRAAAVLEALLGEPVDRVRPPYGRFTSALARWCRENGRRLVLWDLMPGDFVPSAASLPERAEALAGRLLRKARPGSIVVLHEGGAAHPVASATLDAALPRLRDRGLHPALLP